eukprot:3935651-Rhodomonas_salina.3
MRHWRREGAKARRQPGSRGWKAARKKRREEGARRGEKRELGAGGRWVGEGEGERQGCDEKEEAKAEGGGRKRGEQVGAEQRGGGGASASLGASIPNSNTRNHIFSRIVPFMRLRVFDFAV